MSIRIAVLASGRGSNLRAILDAIAEGRLDAEVVGVFSDKPGAAALDMVEAGRRWALDAKALGDRAAFDAAMGDAVEACTPDWIVCAGYMRILGAPFVTRFRGRLINIHPSLLPRHRGLHTHARALQAGDAEHGASVHFVIPELDAGTVIAQVRIPVLPQDTPECLAERLLPQEHRLLCAVLALASHESLSERDGTVIRNGQVVFRPLLLDSSSESDRLLTQ
ncbi:MAG: phosphoribosylglycinamide formyltransferase [Pseudoxanthomonas sp.]